MSQIQRHRHATNEQVTGYIRISCIPCHNHLFVYDACRACSVIAPKEPRAAICSWGCVATVFKGGRSSTRDGISQLRC